jgi:DNA-binding NtrC family response regulator
LQASEPIELLLTDVVMPGGSGTDLYARLAGARPGLKVIYMSGYSEHAAEQAAKGDASAVVLTKPFSRSALLRTTREVLQATNS